MEEKRKPVLLKPEEGRRYDMGRMSALFKADGLETDNKYSISEWWLDPNTTGPGAHMHETEDDMFYVIEGTMDVLIGDDWHTCPKGSFVIAPAGVRHDFRNASDKRAGLLNIFIGGIFENNMPMIVDWFAKNPLADVK